MQSWRGEGDGRGAAPPGPWGLRRRNELVGVCVSDACPSPVAHGLGTGPAWRGRLINPETNRRSSKIPRAAPTPLRVTRPPAGSHVAGLPAK